MQQKSETFNQPYFSVAIRTDKVLVVRMHKCNGKNKEENISKNVANFMCCCFSFNYCNVKEETQKVIQL